MTSNLYFMSPELLTNGDIVPIIDAICLILLSFLPQDK